MDFATKIHDSIPNIARFQCISQIYISPNPTKAHGPDGIHPYALKMCAANLCKPLHLLFMQSLTMCILPK